MRNSYTVTSTAAPQVVPKIVCSAQRRDCKRAALPNLSSGRGNCRKEDSSLTLDGKKRVSLAHVVADCERRWFQSTLREATAGDASQQLLVAHMYHKGYGVPKDVQKGHAWFIRALEDLDSVSSQPVQTDEPDSDGMEAYITFYQLLMIAYVQCLLQLYLPMSTLEDD